jgi:hypothetical protein
MYPIPDDVTPLKTEEIVRYGRCEMRSGTFDRITEDKERFRKFFEKAEIDKLVKDWLKKKLKVEAITPATLVTTDDAVMALVNAIEKIVKDQQKENSKKYEELLNCRPKNKPIEIDGEKPVACPENNAKAIKEGLQELKNKLGERLKKRLGEAHKLRPYLDVAVVYEFEFEITEQNQTKGDVAFRLPLVTQTVDADASAALLSTRKGKRSFKAQDKWGKLISDGELCKDFSVSRRNVLYPLGGSIGVDRVVTTFIDLIDQGGSKDSFVDVLVFTTDVSGGIGASVKLSPVPNSFRLVSAGTRLFGSRVDVHKLTLSLVLTKQESSEAIFGADRFDADLDTPFERPAEWRARYNLCVADGRAREEAFKQMRQTAPEIYCIQFADAFDPEQKAIAVNEPGPGVMRSSPGEPVLVPRRLRPDAAIK